MANPIPKLRQKIKEVGESLSLASTITDLLEQAILCLTLANAALLQSLVKAGKLDQAFLDDTETKPYDLTKQIGGVNWVIKWLKPFIDNPYQYGRDECEEADAWLREAVKVLQLEKKRPEVTEVEPTPAPEPTTVPAAP